MPTFVRAAALGSYPAVASRVGLDAQSMIRAAGLDPGILSNPDLRVPTDAVVTLLEESAERSGCDTFGLQMAESWRLSDFGAVSLLLTHERTLREALAAIIRYRHMLNDALSITIEDAGELVIVREELLVAHAMPARQGIELAIGVVFRLCRALLGPQWRPRGVRFMHSAPQDLAVHRRVFGAGVAFGAEFNGIVCAAADLDRPNPASDPTLVRHARSYLDSMPALAAAPVAREAYRAIVALLPQGKANVGGVARTLGMNSRSMQRQLEASGESFGSVLNAARRDLAVRYLRNPAYSITQVGELLGYSFPSSFTRWFTAEFGQSPAKWRAAAGVPRS